MIVNLTIATRAAHKIINTFAHSWRKRWDLAKAQIANSFTGYGM